MTHVEHVALPFIIVRAKQAAVLARELPQKPKHADLHHAYTLKRPVALATKLAHIREKFNVDH